LPPTESTIPSPISAKSIVTVANSSRACRGVVIRGNLSDRTDSVADQASRRSKIRPYAADWLTTRKFAPWGHCVNQGGEFVWVTVSDAMPMSGVKGSRVQISPAGPVFALVGALRPLRSRSISALHSPLCALCVQSLVCNLWLILLWSAHNHGCGPFTARWPMAVIMYA
jgi:phage terminase large subunit-like protein